jgi:hypothetical protein
MPETQQTVYRLLRGDKLLGTVTHHPAHDDFPWRGGVFEPTPEFDSVRPLFDEELRLLNADRMDEWTVAWDDIERPGLALEPLDGGSPITEFLIHIDGTKTWWRC